MLQTPHNLSVITLLVCYMFLYAHTVYASALNLCRVYAASGLYCYDVPGFAEIAGRGNPDAHGGGEAQVEQLIGELVNW